MFTKIAHLPEQLSISQKWKKIRPGETIGPTKILYLDFRPEGVEIRYPSIKTADSYTWQNFDDFGKYAISVNMEAFILGQVR